MGSPDLDPKMFLTLSKLSVDWELMETNLILMLIENKISVNDFTTVPKWLLVGKLMEQI